MAETTRQILGENVSLLKAKASIYAIYGALIALLTVVAATCLIAFTKNGEISVQGLIWAQQNNATLWILDLFPFIFPLWGQYTSSAIAFEAGAMIIDQTNELRIQTATTEARANYDITHDRLTDLPNRLLLQDRFQQAIQQAQRDRLGMAVLIIDLDRFKDVNDSLGREQGDRLLCQVAARLLAAVSSTETVARVGGNEFIIMLPSISSDTQAIKTASNITNALKSSFELGGGKLDVHASIGIAIYPEDGTNPNDLLQRAEVAMYAAKHEKSDYALYNINQEDHSPLRVTLTGELRSALEENRILLEYQPKLDAGSNEVTAVEVLSRWLHPRHGIIPPDEFIPLAERTGLITAVTAWVLRNAIAQASDWARAGMDISISVNISAQDLHDQDLYDRITGLLAAHDLPAEKLVLEITETSIFIDKERAASMLRRLASIGVGISIDDFGTGYSSLAQLIELPVNEIKIDKSFVIDMIVQSKHAKIVHAIIELGHNLNMKVVAEGVESEEVYNLLQEMGCDCLQGNFISPSLNAPKLITWIRGSPLLQSVKRA